MAIREKVKDDWRATSPIFKPIALALDRLAQWVNSFDATEPLTVEGQGWGVTLGWAPWESPFWHPWKIQQADDNAGKVDVLGGTVYDGSTKNAVAGLTDEVAANGWKAYLKVKHYYATGTASEYTLLTTTGVWPAQSHTATAQTMYIAVGEIVGTTLYQYQYSDLVVPRILPPFQASGNWYLRTTGGTLEWKQAGTCP